MTEAGAAEGGAGPPEGSGPSGDAGSPGGTGPSEGAGPSAAEAPPAPPPSLEEARSWIGRQVDEVGGKKVGRVLGVYSDAEGSAAVWLTVGLGRRGRDKVIVPVRECAGGGSRVWVAETRDAMRGAPHVDPERPLLREHEATICEHYGIGERVGRHAEVAGRPEGSVTAQPAAAGPVTSA